MREGIDFTEIFLRGCSRLSYHRGGQFAGCSGKPGEIFFSGGEGGYKNTVSDGYGGIYACYRRGRPCGVKSADNTRAKSLKVYMATYKPDYAIKLSTKNFGFEDGKKTVPLYAAFCI